MITDTVEISRSPEDVFAYLDQLDRHREWQTQIVSAEVLTEGPPRVGTRVAETRKVGGREQRFTWEITAHEPPRRSAFRGIDGPVRPVGTVTIEPADDGASSALGSISISRGTASASCLRHSRADTPASRFPRTSAA